MRKLAIALFFLAALAHAEDSPLVQAAKASGGPKKKSTKKVITNADVKKSSGKLTVLPTPASGEVKAADGPAKSTVQKHEEQKRAAEASSIRVAAFEKKVAGLERELARIEQSYYESNDPNHRDTVITARFNQTKRQLDDARKELADARDAHKKASPSPAKPASATKSP